jgi:hypothetical protein
MTNLPIPALLLASLVLAAGPGRAADERPRAGRWEVTVEVSASGMALPPSTQAECLSQEDVDADPVPELEKGVCRATNVQRSGARVTWDVACGDAGKGRGEVTYTSSTSYDGWMDLQLGDAAVHAVIRARRTGDCTPPAVR